MPAELCGSVWCLLGTDARDCLYLALNGRMLRALQIGYDMPVRVRTYPPYVQVEVRVSWQVEYSLHHVHAPVQ